MSMVSSRVQKQPMNYLVLKQTHKLLQSSCCSRLWHDVVDIDVIIVVDVVVVVGIVDVDCHLVLSPFIVLYLMYHFKKIKHFLCMNRRKQKKKKIIPKE